VVTNILLRFASNPGAFDNIKLVQVFELLQIAADALAPRGPSQSPPSGYSRSGTVRPPVSTSCKNLQTPLIRSGRAQSRSKMIDCTCTYTTRPNRLEKYFLLYIAIWAYFLSKIYLHGAQK